MSRVCTVIAKLSAKTKFEEVQPRKADMSSKSSESSSIKITEV